MFTTVVRYAFDDIVKFYRITMCHSNHSVVQFSMLHYGLWLQDGYSLVLVLKCRIVVWLWLSVSFPAKKLTHYSCYWGLFWKQCLHVAVAVGDRLRAECFYITVAVGRPFKAGYFRIAIPTGSPF